MGAREEMIEAVAHTIQHGYWEGVTETIAREAARQTLAPWLPDNEGVPPTMEPVNYSQAQACFIEYRRNGEPAYRKDPEPLYRFRPSAVPPCG
jgi:hypothetical protein